MKFATTCTISLAVMMVSIGNVASRKIFEQVCTICKPFGFQRIHWMACISIHVHMGQTRLMRCPAITRLLLGTALVFLMWLRSLVCSFGGGEISVICSSLWGICENKYDYPIGEEWANPNLSCCFCPDWTAANNKERRPKNGERFKSGLEKVMAKVTLKKVT